MDRTGIASFLYRVSTILYLFARQFRLHGSLLSALRSPAWRRLSILFALLIAFHGQPLGVLVQADGYYDEDGNWVEDWDYSYEDPYEDPGYDDGAGMGSYDPYYDPSPDIDSDGDGISDWDEVYGFEILVYEDYESVYYYEEYDPDTGETIWHEETYTESYSWSEWITTDPLDPDTDGDGLPDGWERDNGFHPTDPTDGLADDDGDGLSNGEEFQLGTNMWNADTDGDGYTDGEEVLLLGTNPLDANDPAEPDPEEGVDAGEEGGEGGGGSSGGGGDSSSSGDGEDGSGSGGGTDGESGSGQDAEGGSDPVATEPVAPGAPPVLGLVGNGFHLYGGTLEEEGSEDPTSGEEEWLYDEDVYHSIEVFEWEHKEQLEAEGWWVDYETAGGWMMAMVETRGVYGTVEAPAEDGGVVAMPFGVRLDTYETPAEEEIDDSGKVQQRHDGPDPFPGVPDRSAPEWNEQQRIGGGSAETVVASLGRGTIYPDGRPEVNVWLKAMEPVPEEVQRTYLVVTKSVDINGGGNPETVEVKGSATFTVAEGATISGEAEVQGAEGNVTNLGEGMVQLRASNTPGRRNTVDLLPVELLVPEVETDSDGYRSETGEEIATDGLKVAQWEKLFQGDAENPEITSVFPETDRDRFKLKVGGMMEGLKAYVETVAEDGSQVDNRTEIALNEVQGEDRMESEWNILVTSEKDDEFVNSLGPNDNGPPNDHGGLKRSDRTHLVSGVADKVKITVEFPGGQEHEMEYDLLGRTTSVIEVPVTAVIYNVEPNSYNPIPIVSESHVHDDVAEANKRLAQSNIVLKVKNIIHRDPPTSLVNGLQLAVLSDANGEKLESPRRTILENPATAKKDLELHYVTYLTSPWDDTFDGTLGAAITSSVSDFENYDLPPGCRGIMFISAPNSSYAQMDDPQSAQDREIFKIVTAHEAGHILTDKGHYDGDSVGFDPYPSNVQGNHYPKQNLMKSGAYIGPSSIFGNLRVWDIQVKWIEEGALEMGGKYLERE